MVFLLNCQIGRAIETPALRIKMLEAMNVSFSVTAASLPLAHQKAPGIIEKIMQDTGWSVIVNQTRVLDPE